MLRTDSVFFTTLGYPVSYIEFIGTIFNILGVYLVARRNIWTWPVGLVGVTFFAILFYQIRLYSDFLEQIYYFGASLYGWWFWQCDTNDNSSRYRFSSTQDIAFWIVVTAVGTGVFYLITKNLHIWLPNFFQEPATFVLIDSFTTAASFVAMILMAQKLIECWIYWIVIDAISVWLYMQKNVPFVSLLYAGFLLLAVMGLIEWLKGRTSRHHSRFKL